jgi:hypothetical protein
MPSLTQSIPCPASDRCDRYHRCLCLHRESETVVPCHQQVLSDNRMVSSRPHRHKSDSCVFRITYCYCIKCTSHMEQDRGGEDNLLVQTNATTIRLNKYNPNGKWVQSQWYNEIILMGLFLASGFIRDSGPPAAAVPRPLHVRWLESPPTPRPYAPHSHMYTGPLVIATTPSLLLNRRD